MRNRRAQGALEVVEQVPRRRLGDDELAHSCVAPVERAQLVDPVRVVEKPDVDHPRSAVWNAPLVSEGQTRDQHPVARAQLLRQLAQLGDIDAMVGTIMAAPGLAVVAPHVNEHIADALRVGISEHDCCIPAQRKDAVRVLPRREPPRELEAGVDKNTNRLLEVRLFCPTDDDERHRVSFNRFARRSGTPTAMMSSTAASRIACTEPKCRRRARLRAGPMPSTESSGDVSALRDRTLRWCVMAKRCASSRIRWTRNIPGEFLSCTMGLARPGAKISSRSLASEKVGMSAYPAVSRTSRAALSWPLPPSMRMRSGRLVKERSPTSSASSRR